MNTWFSGIWQAWRASLRRPGFLLLAAAGLYGVLAFSVAQRTREIGVRRAIGAGNGAIVREVGGQLSWQLGIGLLVGTVLAWLWSQLLADPGLHTQAHDPAVFVPVLLLGARHRAARHAGAAVSGAARRSGDCLEVRVGVCWRAVLFSRDSEFADRTHRPPAGSYNVAQLGEGHWINGTT